MSRLSMGSFDACTTSSGSPRCQVWNGNNRGHVYKRRLLYDADLMIAQTRQLLMGLPSCTMLYNCQVMLKLSLLLSYVMFRSGYIFLLDYQFGLPHYGWVGC